MLKKFLIAGTLAIGFFVYAALTRGGREVDNLDEKLSSLPFTRSKAANYFGSEFNRVTGGNYVIDIRMIEKMPFVWDAIEKKNVTEGFVAFAIDMNNPGHRIYVDKSIWNRLDLLEKKQLIYHELAHEHFQAEHVNNIRHLMHGSMVEIRFTEEQIDNQLRQVMYESK